MENALDIFRRITNPSEEDIEKLLPYIEIEKYKKKDIVLSQGEIENYLYYVKEGVMRCFVTKERDGNIKETTIEFVFSGSFHSSYHSFLKQEPSLYSIECLTDLELYRVSYDNVQEIYKNTDSGEKFGRLSAEQLFIKKYLREISLLTETVDERYLYLVENHPRLLQKIPLKYLASYIGVTPQALSNIRRRVYKKKIN